jgi:beta-N-acetylhexosaminidase
MALPRVLGALAALTGLLLACSPATEKPAASPSGGPSNTSLGLPLPGAPVPPACGDVLASMSTRDKLAQLLMVGVTGADDARAVVDNQHVGGIMIGSWTDLSMMGAPLADIAASAGPLPLAVSTDEEGGRVSRLADMIGEQPSPRVLAQTKTPAEVHDIAFQRGQAMRGLGVTIDFAPVVDVTTESDDEVIGDRSFGSDPAQVVEFAGAYAQGLRDAGVLPVLKHFPGHGHASGDSHEGGVVTPPLADLQTNDLVPYRTLTTHAPVAVMVGHMQVPGLTGTDPASLSPAAYGLLRSGDYGGPGFGGLVFSDDLSSMGAINQRYGVADAALRALQAGADVALWVTTDEVPAVLDRLEKALNAGELSQAKVDDSVLKLAGQKGPNPRC